MAYYISFLKTLSLKLDSSTVQFFFNSESLEFPLYTESIKFFNHQEGMVRTGEKKNRGLCGGKKNSHFFFRLLRRSNNYACGFQGCGSKSSIIYCFWEVCALFFKSRVVYSIKV